MYTDFSNSFAVAFSYAMQRKLEIQQKLSYRKQIARKLRTQYVAGMSSNL